jgi:class 3 adenylate cyclase
MSTGPVIAGVIGAKRSSFDLWGETVNLASRMQTSCSAGSIQVTESTYQALKGEYDFEARGVIPVKGVGEMCTYLLIGEKTNDSAKVFGIPEMRDEAARLSMIEQTGQAND